MQAIDLVHIERGRSLRDYTVECTSTDHARRIVEAVKRIDDLEVRSVSDNTFLNHLGGKPESRSRSPLQTRAMACWRLECTRRRRRLPGAVRR